MKQCSRGTAFFNEYMTDAGLIQKNILANKHYLNDFFGGTMQRKKETIASGGKKDIVFLDPEQREFMLRYMHTQINWDNGRVATQVGLIANLVAATTGLRHQEIQALLPSDFIVHPEGVRISVKKAYRLSPAMPLWAHEIVERYLKRRDKYLLERGLWFENLPVTMSLNDHTHTWPTNVLTRRWQTIIAWQVVEGSGL